MSRKRTRWGRRTRRDNTRTSVGTFAKILPIWTPEIWNVGWVACTGRFKVYRPDYPRAWINGYAHRAHVVWWLTTGEVPTGDIHHIDEDKLNDKFENLEHKPHGKHSRDHKLLKPVIRICTACKKEFYFSRKRSQTDPSRGKYCGQKCYHIVQRSDAHKKAISNGLKRAYKDKRR